MTGKSPVCGSSEFCTVKFCINVFMKSAQRFGDLVLATMKKVFAKTTVFNTVDEELDDDEEEPDEAEEEEEEPEELLEDAPVKPGASCAIGTIPYLNAPLTTGSS